MVLSEFLFFILIFFLPPPRFPDDNFYRQAGPLQNFNRSHVMVIGRSVSFPTPHDPRVGAWGAQTPPKSPPPEKIILQGKKTFRLPPPPPPSPQLFFVCLRFKTPGICFGEEKKIQLLKTSTYRVFYNLDK